MAGFADRDNIDPLSLARQMEALSYHDKDSGITDDFVIRDEHIESGGRLSDLITLVASRILLNDPAMSRDELLRWGAWLNDPYREVPPTDDPILREAVATWQYCFAEDEQDAPRASTGMGDKSSGLASTGDPSESVNGLSKDGRTLDWDGKQYPISTTASAVVRILEESYWNGVQFLHEQYLKAESEVESDIRNIVRDNNLKDVVVRQMKERKRVNGMWGLVELKKKS